MAWVHLFLAGSFEVIWVVSLKYSQGLTRIYPSIFMVIGMLISLYFLSLATKTLPIGTAYAVWTGIGAVGAVIIGMLLFNEPRDLNRIIFASLIIIGVIGLRCTSPTG